MTELLFSFDTEDYVNPEGADGILRCARILREAGIKGCYCVVTRLAEALVKWGRTDVLEELKHHEISLHSYAHSLHPTINEYTDIADYGEAMERFLSQEVPARETTGKIFGLSDFPAACPPGCSISYVAHYGYAKMGVPIYTADYLVDSVRGRPVVNCNIASLGYDNCLERYLLQNGREEIDRLLDEIAETRDVYIFYHHPQMALLSVFCDEINMKGENTPEDQWQPSPKRPAEDVERFYENFRYLVNKVKDDPRFHLTTYREFADKHCYDTRVLRPNQIPALKAQLQARMFPVTEPDSYCISDIFLACRDFLLGEKEHVCEEVYGFLETPYTMEAPCSVTAEALRASAKTIGDGFLPQYILVGDRKLGPAEWLFAAMDVLSGAETVELQPCNWQIDMDQFPFTRDQNLAGTWVHSPAFRDHFLSHRYRLQSWTIRLPKHTQRFIFH